MYLFACAQVRRCDAEGWARRAAQQRYRNPLQAQNEPFTATPRLGGSDGRATPRLGNSHSTGNMGSSSTSSSSTSSSNSSRFGFDFVNTNETIRESGERESGLRPSSSSAASSSELPLQGRPRRASSADDLTFAEPKVPPSHRRGGPAHSVSNPSASRQQESSGALADPGSNGRSSSSDSSMDTGRARYDVRDPSSNRTSIISGNSRDGDSSSSNSSSSGSTVPFPLSFSSIGSRPIALSVDSSQQMTSTRDGEADAKGVRSSSNGSSDECALNSVDRADYYDDKDDDSAVLGLELEPLDLSDENVPAATVPSSSSRPGFAPLSLASPVPALQWHRFAAAAAAGASASGSSHASSSAVVRSSHIERKSAASSNSGGRESPPFVQGSGHLPQLSERSNASSCWSSPRSEPGSARLGGGFDGGSNALPLLGGSARSSTGSSNGDCENSNSSSASASALEKRQASEEKRRWWLTRLSVLEAAGSLNSYDVVTGDYDSDYDAKASSTNSGSGGSRGGGLANNRDLSRNGDAKVEATAGSTAVADGAVRFPSVVPAYGQEGFGVRAAKVAAADEEAQRRLHSQTLPASWAPASSFTGAAAAEAKGSSNRLRNKGQRSHQSLTRADFKAAVEALEDSADDSAMLDDDDASSAANTGSNRHLADDHHDSGGGHETEVRVEKAFFVEPLPWMDLLGAVAAARDKALAARTPHSGVLHSESTGLGPRVEDSEGGCGNGGGGGGGGSLGCPGCGCELGRWGWEKRPSVSPGSEALSPFSPASSNSKEAPSSSFDGDFGNMDHAFGFAHAYAQAAAASTKPLLRIAVLRKRVFASPLPSEVVTPREDKDAGPGRARGGSGATTSIGRGRSGSSTDRLSRSPLKVPLESHVCSPENEAKGSKETDSRA